MAETATTEAPKRGNPNFGRKENSPKYDPKKRYHFQLMKSHDHVKPRDADTGEMMDNPFPPLYFIEPQCTAINPETNEIEYARFISGYSSIWIKDQNKPEPSEAQLVNPKNFIEFKNGNLFVSGVNTALLDFLHIQDEFEEVKNAINPKPPTYRLVNPEKEIKLVRNNSDLRFEASKAAREASVEEMLPIAMHYGINVDDWEENLERIRTEFIFRAESDPEGFNRQFTNPKIKYKYIITQALRMNLISATQIPNKMVLVDTGKVYFDVKDGDVADQFAGLVSIRNNQATDLYNHIENLVKASK